MWQMYIVDIITKEETVYTSSKKLYRADILNNFKGKLKISYVFITRLKSEKYVFTSPRVLRILKSFNFAGLSIFLTNCLSIR